MTNRFFDLTDHVAVVTGSGRGIGEGIARMLAEAGASVVCGARRTEEIEKVAASIRDAGGWAIAVPTDVTDPAAVEALCDTAVKEFGHLDILVNNAGGSAVQTPLAELSDADWDATIALNLTAVWKCTQIAVRRMRSGGCVLNISSMASMAVTPGSGHYAAAKAACNSLTQYFAQELAPDIRVNAILPGFVPTEIVRTALSMSNEQLEKLGKHITVGRLGTPEDLGLAALYLCSPASAWVTGQCIPIDGGSFRVAAANK